MLASVAVGAISGCDVRTDTVHMVRKAARFGSQSADAVIATEVGSRGGNRSRYGCLAQAVIGAEQAFDRRLSECRWKLRATDVLDSLVDSEVGVIAGPVISRRSMLDRVQACRERLNFGGKLVEVSGSAAVERLEL